MRTEALQRNALAYLKDAPDEAPCPAVVGMAVLDSLGFGDEEVRDQGAFLKLKGRPCGEVRKFRGYAARQPQESRQHLLTRFCKNVKAIEGSP